MAIEILENTLLKLLVRRGTNSDRQEIVLQSGELGFTTDTERLYIGNSTTAGGLVVGNKYKGSTSDVTTLVGVVTGDYAYEVPTRALKVCERGTGAEADDWRIVSNYLSAGDNTINIDSQGLITVGTSPGGGLSASNIDFDALGKSGGDINFGVGLTLDNSLRATLSSTIRIDRIINNITTTGGNYLGLPRTLNIANVNYTFPSTKPAANDYLGWDGSTSGGTDHSLQWSNPGIVLAGVAPTTASMIPVGSIVPYASAGGTMPWGWLACNGSEYISTSYPDLSAVIGTNYNTGGETSTDYFRVPDLTNKLLYNNYNPSTSTVMSVTTAVSANSEVSLLSATGMQFIIKSIGGITSPTMTVGKNLSALVSGVDKTDITFNPLSGDVVIERVVPGQIKYGVVGAGPFIMPAGISYVKYYVTGSGARAGRTIGGAAATCIGYLSAAPGTVFPLTIGEGPSVVAGSDQHNGNASTIWTPGDPETALVTSYGGIYFYGIASKYGQGNTTGDAMDIGQGTGEINLGPYVINGNVILGGAGSVPTNNANVTSGHAFYHKRENRGSVGAASYWGNAPAPGAGQAGFNSQAQGQGYPPTNGMILFEWN